MSYILQCGWALCVCDLVKVMRCTSCGAELILTKVVPDESVALRGLEHHTLVCSACHVTEHRVLFIKHGRETDSLPMPMQAAQPMKRRSTEQDDHVAVPGLLNRVLALVRRQ
jgi:hypothetical protein